MKSQVHKVSSVPKINHDLAGDHLHLFVLDFPSGIIELPSSVGFNRILAFKKIHPDAGEITIIPNHEQAIDGEPALVLKKQYETAVLASAEESGWLVATAFPGNQGDK